MLTPSHFPTLLHSHTHRLVLFEQLCSALCMFISAIVMVLLSFLPLLRSIMSLWETIGEPNWFGFSCVILAAVNLFKSLLYSFGALVLLSTEDTQLDARII